MKATILRDLHTKQRKPKLICRAGTVAEVVEYVENGTWVVLRLDCWKELVALPAREIR